MPATKTTAKKETKGYRPMVLVRVYRMARAGMSDKDICTALGIVANTLWKWERKYPELRETFELARGERANQETLADWVYDRLSPEMKDIWNKIDKWGKEKSGTARIDLLLSDQGKTVRQHLFLYALCACNFSPSAAMRKLGLTRRELQDWSENDPDFARLVSEVDWHKGNFYEEQLVRLVREGVPAAVLFANRTYNKGRGYAPSSTLDVNVSGSVAVGVFDIAELAPYLSEGAKAELLSALRRREEDARRLPPTAEQLLESQIARVGEEPPAAAPTSP